MKLTLKIPENASLIPKIRDKVALGDPFYSVGSDQSYRLQVAKPLSIKPKEIFVYLKKLVGDSVNHGEIIAEKKGFLGKKTVCAEQTGIITGVNHNTGDIIISYRSEEKKTVKAYFTAGIEDYNSQTKLLKLSFSDSLGFDLNDVSQSDGGQVCILPQPDDYLNVDESQVQDRIVIVEELSPHAATKFEALGAKGFIFLTGSTPTESPYAKIKKINDFKTMVTEKKEYVLFSDYEKKVLVYNVPS